VQGRSAAVLRPHWMLKEKKLSWQSEQLNSLRALIGQAGTGIFLLREIQSTFYLKDCVIYTVHLRISLALLFKINKYRLKQTEKCYQAG